MSSETVSPTKVNLCSSSRSYCASRARRRAASSACLASKARSLCSEKDLEAARRWSILSSRS